MPKTILVADDSVTIQEAMKLAFTGEPNVSLRFVDDGDSALREALSGSYDVVFCDHNMPGLDGYELAEALKDDPKTAHLPLMLLTGSSKSYDEARAKQIGIDDQIKKPFRVQVLLEKTRALLAKAASRPAPVIKSAPAQTQDVYHATENATTIAPVPLPPTQNNAPMMTNPFVPAVASPFAPPPLTGAARVNPFAPAPVVPVPQAPTQKANPFAPPPVAISSPRPSPFAPSETARSETTGPSIVLGDSHQDAETGELRATSTLLGMPVLNLNNNQNKPNLRPPAPTAPATLPPPVPPVIRPPTFNNNRVTTLPPPKPPTTLPQPPTFRPPTARPDSSSRLPIPTNLFEDDPSKSVVPVAEDANISVATSPSPFQPEDSAPAEVTITPEVAAAPVIETAAKTAAPVVAETPVQIAKDVAHAETAKADAPVSEEMLRQVLSQASRDMIERIVWEVVPDLAESIIRTELQRLLSKLPTNT